MYPSIMDHHIRLDNLPMDAERALRLARRREFEAVWNQFEKELAGKLEGMGE